MTCIDNLTPEDLLILTNIIAISLTKDKNADEINALGTFIVTIGGLMLALATQQRYLLSLQEKSNTTEK